MKPTVSYSIDDATLVQRCRENDPPAQKMLYMKYAEDMMLLCLRYITNGEDAKEILMDSFLGFFKNMKSFTWYGEGSVKAWLKKIVVNNCLGHLRKKNPAFIANGELPHECADDSETALDALNAKQILRMIHTLPDGYRAVFNLYVFEGMNHKEIAEALNISESTSKSQLHRARAILKGKILQTS